MLPGLRKVGIFELKQERPTHSWPRCGESLRRWAAVCEISCRGCLKLNQFWWNVIASSGVLWNPGDDVALRAVDTTLECAEALCKSGRERTRHPKGTPEVIRAMKASASP